MAYVGRKHFNPHTGLECECPWGGTSWQHTASLGVRKLRNQNMKIFRDARGQAFLDRLDKLLDQHPEAEAMTPWFAQQFKSGELDVAASYDPDGYNSGIFMKGDYMPDIRRYVPVWGQWMQARQHPLRRGVNIMELDVNDLNRVAHQLQSEVAEKQSKRRWVDTYGEYSDPEHIFGPEAGEHQGWQVHHISDAYEAMAETEALGHCIGSDEQPYKNAIDNGEISAWSLRDPEGYPHVSWHHNPSGGLAHIQGKSGYPKPEYRNLISQFNNMKEMDDDGGGAGEERLDEIQEAYDYYVEGPPVSNIEDYTRYYGDDGYSNLMDWAINSGRYNLPEYDMDVEANPGPVSWDEIAREAEDSHQPDKWGYDPDNISHVEQYELDDLHGTIQNNNHEALYEKAIGGPQWEPGNSDHINSFEDIARAPNAMAAWLDHQGYLDEDWIPLNDPRRKELGANAPTFPQQPAPAYGPPTPIPPGQLTFDNQGPGRYDPATGQYENLPPAGDPNQPFHPQTNPAGWVTPPPDWQPQGQIGQPIPAGRHANILDPIHDKLDPSVFDDPARPEPTIKAKHRDWIRDSVYRTLDNAGYDGMDEWLQLIFTGSLTTYQYSPDSDVDISLFVNVDKLPEWSRAEMIGIMVEHMDGTTLPGTTHPMQCFVVPHDVDVTDLYKPGLRSGYDLGLQQWIVAPERSRVHNVAQEMNAAYVHALEQADKMDRLLKYEPDKAVQLWHQIHKRRRRDQMAGKGDYSDSNITYKMLANRGLFPAISDVSGEYIAKASGLLPTSEQIEEARQQLGLKVPVRVLPTYDKRGGYAGITRDPFTGQQSHLVYVNPEKAHGPRNWALWHELGHAQRIEQGGEFTPNNEQSDEEYWQSPNEQHAEGVANQYADHDLWRNS